MNGCEGSRYKPSVTSTFSIVNEHYNQLEISRKSVHKQTQQIKYIFHSYYTRMGLLIIHMLTSVIN